MRHAAAEWPRLSNSKKSPSVWGRQTGGSPRPHSSRAFSDNIHFWNEGTSSPASGVSKSGEEFRETLPHPAISLWRYSSALQVRATALRRTRPEAKELTDYHSSLAG